MTRTSSPKRSPTCRTLLLSTSNTRMQRMSFTTLVIDPVPADTWLPSVEEEEAEYEEEAPVEEEQ